MKNAILAGLLTFSVLSVFTMYRTSPNKDEIAFLKGVEKQREERDRQEYVDTAMRKAGTCRWWLLVHDLSDKAYSKPENIPDYKFRNDMDRRCPEARYDFVGPHDREYYEDRARWAKEYDKFRPKGH